MSKLNALDIAVELMHFNLLRGQFEWSFSEINESQIRHSKHLMINKDWSSWRCGFLHLIKQKLDKLFFLHSREIFTNTIWSVNKSECITKPLTKILSRTAAVIFISPLATSQTSCHTHMWWYKTLKQSHYTLLLKSGTYLFVKHLSVENKQRHILCYCLQLDVFYIA